MATPEEMAVNESVALAEALPEAGLALDALIANAVLPQRFSAPSSSAVAGSASAAAAGGPPRRLCEPRSPKRRVPRTQRAELERLREVVPPIPIAELPFLFSADFGIDELERLAEEIG